MATSLALQRDGRIVVAGATLAQVSDLRPDMSPSDVAVVRYRADGELDSGFAAGGIATTHVGLRGIADAVALGRKGTIVAAGSVSSDLNSKFALVAYRPDGSLDPRFGRHGVVLTKVGGRYSAAHAVAVQRNGKVLAAGESDGAHRTRFGFALVRYRGFANR